MKLGGSLNGSNIKEGDDVYFECEVLANPPPNKITWKHNVSFTTISFIFSHLVPIKED